MIRKWAALAVMPLSAALIATGLSLADDEASPLHKLMEKVQVKDTTIKKGVRSKTNYAKGQKDVAASAEELVKLSKEAKTLINDAARKTAKGKGVANPDEEWNARSDDFTKESETFAKLVADKATTSDKAKAAYKAVQKSCNACHENFRGEEE